MKPAKEMSIAELREMIAIYQCELQQRIIMEQNEPDFYHSFDRITGLRHSDTMTREQYSQMMKRIEEKHGK